MFRFHSYDDTCDATGLDVGKHGRKIPQILGVNGPQNFSDSRYDVLWNTPRALCSFNIDPKRKFINYIGLVTTPFPINEDYRTELLANIHNEDVWAPQF